MACLALGAAGLCWYVVAGAGRSPGQRAATVALAATVDVVALAALAVAARRRPAPDRAAWVLLGGAQLVAGATDLLAAASPELVAPTGSPAAIGAAHVLLRVLLIGGLALLARRRGPRDRAAAVDATVIALAGGLLSWVFVARPWLPPDADAALRIVVASQPVLDGVALALVLAITLPRGYRTLAPALLLAAVALDLTSLFGAGPAGASHGWTGLPAASWLAAHLLLGVWALHPEAGRATGLGTGHRPHVGRLRLGVLAAASLAAPATLLVQDRLGGPVDVATGSLACAVLCLLVLARLAGLLAAARVAAVTDELTGLANRALFLEQVQGELVAGRRDDTNVAVLFLDVDRFKLVNDAMGHVAGDELLVTLADRLRGCLRAGDAAGRHGGDSFTALLTGLTGPEDAAEAAERVRVALNRPVMIAGQRVECSVSVGVAVDVDVTDSAEDLLRHADTALYQAKGGGRNRVRMFDRSAAAADERKLGEGFALRDALEDGQFVAWFQPVVDITSGRIVGAEALARWTHPTLGVLAPGRFLPLAAEIGLISTISRQIVLQTMDLRRQLAPLVDPDFRLSFNLGIGEYNLVQIIDRIMIAAAERGAPPSGLTLEILETAVIEDVKGASVALALAREAGFAVALDDFGTGYSSLSLLRDLPLDTIKIDRSFVRRMADSPADAAIVQSVVDLAGDLRLGVIAEGVETDAERTHLIALGATRAQGFHYSPAVPAARLIDWLRDGPPWITADGHDAGRATQSAAS